MPHQGNAFYLGTEHLCLRAQMFWTYSLLETGGRLESGPEQIIGSVLQEHERRFHPSMLQAKLSTYR